VVRRAQPMSAVRYLRKQAPLQEGEGMTWLTLLELIRKKDPGSGCRL
jgi:hypothetical protein